MRDDELFGHLYGRRPYMPRFGVRSQVRHGAGINNVLRNTENTYPKPS